MLSSFMVLEFSIYWSRVPFICCIKLLIPHNCFCGSFFPNKILLNLLTCFFKNFTWFQSLTFLFSAYCLLPFFPMLFAFSLPSLHTSGSPYFFSNICFLFFCCQNFSPQPGIVLFISTNTEACTILFPIYIMILHVTNSRNRTWLPTCRSQDWKIFSRY